MPLEIPEDLILYHYTTATTLKLIVQNQSIRATCLAYLNDRKEVVHGRDELVKWCDEVLEDENRPHAIRGLQDMKSVAKNYDIRNLFGVSFSTNGDLLSQWRGYANQGSGFAIGFDTRKFDSNLLKLAYGHR